MVTRSARRLVGIAGAPVVALTMLAGCTFLIPFDDVAATPETGPMLMPDTSVGADASVDMNVVDSGPDARDAIANPAACKGNGDGKYCGGDQIIWPADRKDDLITCEGGVVSKVHFCDLGIGCISMLGGYPDECDECAKKADGMYCGRDLTGWDTKNANQRIRCDKGREVGLLLCTTCKSNGAASACQ